MRWKALSRMSSVMLVLSLGLSLAACSKPESKDTSSADGKDKTITLQTFLKEDGTSPREKALAQIIKNFTEKTGIKVKYSVLPWQEVDSQLMLSVQAGNPPDVSFSRDRAFQKLMQANALLPLDDFIKKDLTDKDKKDFIFWDKVGVYNNKKYTFPTSFVAFSLIVRKDLLQSAGLEVPKTFDDFVKVGKALNSPAVAGYLYGASPVQPSQLDWFQSIIEGYGGKVLDDKGKAAFDSDAGVAAFQFLKSAIYDNKITPSTAATQKFDDVTAAFSAGRVAMIIDGSHRYQQMAQALGPDKVQAAFIPGLSASKASPAGVNGWTLGIPKNSKNPKEAWEFIKYFTSAESVLLYSKISGEIPIRQSITSDEYFKTPNGEITRWFMNYANENGSLSVAPASVQELSDIVVNAMQEIITNPNSNVKDIVKAAAQKYNQLVK